MYIILREDIFDFLGKSLGKPLAENSIRIGRIEYGQSINTEYIIKIESEKDEIEFKMNRDYELRKTYDKNIGTYDEYKNKHLEEHLLIEKKETLRQIYIYQHYWINDDEIVVASGLKISSDSYCNMLLGQTFYITDKFKDPSFEDTKSIEWNLINGFKSIIILPKKISKGARHYSIIYGKKDFFDKTEVWKTNI